MSNRLVILKKSIKLNVHDTHHSWMLFSNVKADCVNSYGRQSKAPCIPI